MSYKTKSKEMDMRKPKLQKVRHRSCEKVTQNRADDLAGYGKRSAILAKSKGKTVDDWSVYCGLIGNNNMAAWRSGWDKEWEKMNNA